MYAARRGRVIMGRDPHRAVRGGEKSRGSWDVGFLPNNNPSTTEKCGFTTLAFKRIDERAERSVAVRQN